MRMLLAAGLIIAGIVVVLFGVGVLLPAEWNVERSTIINAPRERVYPLIANFKTGWNQWNPFIDSTMTFTYSGPDEGIGATQNWQGGETNGGVVRITKADPRQGVEFALSFGPATIDGKMALASAGASQTRVTWTDNGKMAGLPIYRFMRFGVARFVGTPMERGLAALKQQAESSAPSAAGI